VPSAQRPPTSPREAVGERGLSRVSMRACATSCSTAISSTRCAKPRSSSKAGGGTTTQSGRTPRSVTAPRPRGVCASAHRMAGCATPTSSAGHAPAGAKTNPKLTFQSDHLLGAGQALVSFMHRGSSLLSLLRHAPGRECRIEKHRSSTGADRRKCFVMMGRGADAARCIKLKCL
jgi:hypothetical protein